MDLDGDFASQIPVAGADLCIALDVIEHLDDPEKFLSQVFELVRAKGKLMISTANVCYIVMRILILFGQFNYGKRGILDRTHKRLFSVKSFRRLLPQYGFRVEKVIGFAPPFSDMVSGNLLFRIVERIHSLLSRLFPNLFSYNFLVIATRMDSVYDVFERTIHEHPGTTAGVNAD